MPPPLLRDLPLRGWVNPAPALLVTKRFLPALFVLTALVGPRQNLQYFRMIFAGLLFCAAGDGFLEFFSSRELFMSGLLSFFAGRVLYGAAFFTAGSPGTHGRVVAALCPLVSGSVFA